MIPAGYGFEVLRFEHESLRDIVKLPEDVRILGALPELAEFPVAPGWRNGISIQPIFILICHRYCVRVPKGCAFYFSSIEDFLKRYHQLSDDECKPLTPWAEGMPPEVWHRDPDGKLREYIWIADIWVPRG